jgi:hypothetical protein
MAIPGAYEDSGKVGGVISPALSDWRSSGLARLRELEQVHAQATGSAPGRRWGTAQLNRSLLVVLVAQFQGFCRALHDSAVDVQVGAAVPGQKALLRTLLTQARKLDTQNPRTSALGADFGRLGFSFIDDLKACGVATRRQLEGLEQLIDYRNAIGHGDETRIVALENLTDIRSTKGSYQHNRRSLNSLAGTMDDVVATQLTALLGVTRPW